MKEQDKPKPIAQTFWEYTLEIGVIVKKDDKQQLGVSSVDTTTD